MLWKDNMGPLDFYVDEQLAATVDCGELPPRFAELIGDGAMKTQLLFESEILPQGDHTVSLVVKDSLGPGRGVGVGLEAFDYIDASFAGQCRSDSGLSNGYHQGPDSSPSNEGYKQEL